MDIVLSELYNWEIFLSVFFTALHHCLPEFVICYLLIAAPVFGVFGVAMCIRKKKPLRAIMCILIAGTVIIGVLQCDFVKSRKTIDTNWMIGKTVSQVRFRYSGILSKPKVGSSIMVGEEEYKYCVREIITWDTWNNNTGEALYFVKTDDDGKIIDVKKKTVNLDLPASEYLYKQRW